MITTDKGEFIVFLDQNNSIYIINVENPELRHNFEDFK